MKEKLFVLKNNILKFQNVVCNCITRVILFLGYILIVIPTAVLMKVFKRDRLNIRPTEKFSYWKKYDNTDTNYERQF